MAASGVASKHKPRGKTVTVGVLPAKQRREEGKARRRDCPRTSHGQLGHLSADRNVVGLITASNEGRLEMYLPRASSHSGV